jgi:diacylglycerol kinase (ATP)
MKRGFLIFNPSAGMNKKSDGAVAEVIRAFEQQDIDITPSPTFPHCTVVTQVQELLSHEPDLLVSWGGDGTVNEIVNGMFGHDIPLGVLPGGTANLLARELRIPARIPEAIRVIAAGNTKSISVGRANGRYFLLMVGIGFDSEVIRNVDWNLKKTVGNLAFGVAAVKTAAQYQYPKFHVKVDGQEKECVFAVVCNGREYGAYFRLAPDADLADDCFYVCLFKEAGWGNMLRYALHALTSTHHTLKDVEIIKATQLEASGPDVPVQADGELIGFLPMKFAIHPGSLQIFVP